MTAVNARSSLYSEVQNWLRPWYSVNFLFNLISLFFQRLNVESRDLTDEASASAGVEIVGLSPTWVPTEPECCSTFLLSQDTVFLASENVCDYKHLAWSAGTKKMIMVWAKCAIGHESKVKDSTEKRVHTVCPFWSVLDCNVLSAPFTSLVELYAWLYKRLLLFFYSNVY